MMYHMLRVLLKNLLHFICPPRQGVPFVDTSIFTDREKSLDKIMGERIEAHSVLFLYQLLYLLCVCKALNSIYFVEIKLPSFSWYRGERAKRNGVL